MPNFFSLETSESDADERYLSFQSRELLLLADIYYCLYRLGVVCQFVN
jgi:hypothetical protein